jgi:hypothetical protein
MQKSKEDIAFGTPKSIAKGRKDTDYEIVKLSLNVIDDAVARRGDKTRSGTYRGQNTSMWRVSMFVRRYLGGRWLGQIIAHNACLHVSRTPTTKIILRFMMSSGSAGSVI